MAHWYLMPDGKIHRAPIHRAPTTKFIAVREGNEEGLKQLQEMRDSLGLKG